MRTILALAAIAAGPAFAACPPPKDHSADLDVLIRQIQTVPDEATAQVVSQAMWRLWATAPDALAQDMLDQGMVMRAQYAFDEAIILFTDLIEYCPDYAEGYNQRAFALFLKRDFDLALVDLDRALERSPMHIAALSGKGLTLIGMGREDEGREILREALELNPWLPERHLLTDMAKPKGEDL